MKKICRWRKRGRSRSRSRSRVKPDFKPDCGFTFYEDVIIKEGESGNVILRGQMGCRQIAVKKMPSEKMDLAEKEIKILEKHDAHPNVIRYFASRRNVLFIYLAFELATGNLSEYCDSPQYNSVLSPREVCIQITKGLKHLHDLNIVHRNLKPSNILFLLVRENEILIKISDYALAKTLEYDRQSFTSSCTVGAPEWAAPEMLSHAFGVRKTFKADIHSLGLVFFTVLTIGRPIPKDLEDLGDVPNGAQRLLLRQMVDKIPDNRPTTADILVQPAFWPPAKTLSFIQELNNLAPRDFNFEVYKERVFESDWKSCLCPKLVELVSTGRKRPFDGSSFKDLVRFMRFVVMHRPHMVSFVPYACTSNERLLQYFDQRIPNMIYYAWLTAKDTPLQESLSCFYE